MTCILIKITVQYDNKQQQREKKTIYKNIYKLRYTNKKRKQLKIKI